MSKEWNSRRRLGEQLEGNSSRGYRTINTPSGAKIPVNVVNGITYDLTTGRPMDPRYLQGLTSKGDPGFNYLSDKDPFPSRMTDFGTEYKQEEIDAGKSAEKSRPGAGFSDTAISTDNTIIDFSDIGDEYDKGAGADDKPGAGPSDEEIRTDQGFPQKGRNLGLKPINIPDFALNPFEAAGLKTIKVDTDGAAAIGMNEKPAEIPETGKINEEGAASIGVESTKPRDPRPEIPKPREVESYNGDFSNDYGEYENYEGPSALEVGRSRAVLDPKHNGSPMSLLRARNAAMGTAFEEDGEGRMTGRTIFNNDGTPEVFAEGQEKDYYGDPQGFLKGVMDGSVKIGTREKQVSGEFEQEVVPFDAKTGYKSDYEPDPAKFGVKDVDFTDVSSVIPFDDGGVTPDAGDKGIGELRIPNSEYGTIPGSLDDAYPQLKGLGLETAFDPQSNSWRILSTIDKDGKRTNY